MANLHRNEALDIAFRRVITQWNNTPRADNGHLAPDEKVNGVEKCLTETKYHFKHFHLFGYLVYILNNNLQDNKTQPKLL